MSLVRALLIGMNNPLSDDPEYDLFPYPEGSAGWRLWKMLPGHISRAEYLQMFDRVNLLRARAWDPHAARAAAEHLRPLLVGRVVVVLGTEVRAALGLPRTAPLIRQYDATHQFEWVGVPHPSGRNLWYNDPTNKTAVGAMLWGLVSACRDGDEMFQ